MQQWLDIQLTEVGRRMRAKGMLSGVLFSLSLALSACGGEAQHGPSATAGAGSGAGGSSNGAGATGSGGTEASGAFPEFKTNFETTQPQQGIGLWMGLGEQLPVGMPPVAHDGTALHLMGDSGTAGLDVFFHTPAPVETLAKEVSFWAYSEKASSLTIGIAGPEATYFTDHIDGIPWPEQTFELGAEWKRISFPLDELSVTPPHEKPYGAVHFVVPPGMQYDFWIDDFTLSSTPR
jgi:hypothetical protein